MDARQLTKMIAAEVVTYVAFGCVIGCALGLDLNKMIYESFITAYYGEFCMFPLV
jgi:ABC-type antimicrobial peptide transport system permease subunit